MSQTIIFFIATLFFSSLSQEVTLPVCESYVRFLSVPTLLVSHITSLSSNKISSGQILTITGNGFLAADASLLKCAWRWSVESGDAPSPTLTPATIVSDSSVTCVAPVHPVGVLLDLHVAVSIDGGLQFSNELEVSIEQGCSVKIEFISNLLFSLTNLVFSLLSLLPLGVNIAQCPGTVPTLFGSQCLLVSGASGLVYGVVDSIVALLSGVIGVVTGSVGVTVISACAAI